MSGCSLLRVAMGGLLIASILAVPACESTGGNDALAGREGDAGVLSRGDRDSHSHDLRRSVYAGDDMFSAER